MDLSFIKYEASKSKNESKKVPSVDIKTLRKAVDCLKYYRLTVMTAVSYSNTA